MSYEILNSGSNQPLPERLEQLDYLSRLLVEGEPILIHGSIGHAAMMGAELPSQTMPNGSPRDIDVYTVFKDKWELESDLLDLGLSQPQPVDAGMASLIVREGQNYFASLDGITTELKDTAVLEEVAEYEVKDSDGVVIKSFTAEGMLAAHLMKPATLRFGHIRVDRQLDRWFHEQGTNIPAGLKSSINEFHRAHKAAYPRKQLLDSLAQVYVTVLPDILRSKFRKHTHRFMHKHTGRVTPYSDSV